MKKRKSTWLYCSMLAVLLLIAVYTPIPSLAAEVWSDDFDDGNLNGWQILTGGFDVSDGYANGSESDYNPMYHYHNFFNTMNRSSTVVVGTWSFDLFPPPNLYYSMWNVVRIRPGVHFISAGNYSAFTEPSHSGYALKMDNGENPVFRLMKIINCSDYLLAFYVTEKGYNEWFHIDITRNDDSELNVWIDGEHAMRFTDTDYSESTNLIVDVIQYMCIDNVTVSDTIDLTPPSTETTTTTTDETTTADSTTEAGLPFELLAIGVGGVVVLIVIVVFLRKR